MLHKRIRMQKENSVEILRKLGELEDALEFIDMTKDDDEASKSYSFMINRCDLLLQKISEYDVLLKNFHISQNTYNSCEQFKKDLAEDMKREKEKGFNYFDLVENEILDNDKKIKDLVDTHTKIREDLINLVEKFHVLMAVPSFYRNQPSLRKKSIDHFQEESEEIEIIETFDFDFITGLVDVVDELKMKRMIFRVSKGRAIPIFYNLELDPRERILTEGVKERGFSFSRRNLNKNLFEFSFKSSQISNKKIFTIIFPSGQRFLLEKLLQVCDFFNCSRYRINKDTIKNEIEEITHEISIKEEFLKRAEASIRDITTKALVLISEKKKYRYDLYRLFILQEKMIYLTLNKCKIRGTFIDGEFWVPKVKFEKIQNLLNDFSKKKNNQIFASLEDTLIKENATPPTYIESNDFLWAFQEIVNTYGIPRYKEINPAYFNVVTFPFLFGVMFGDIGHGLVIFLFGLYLCIFDKMIVKKNSALVPFLKARYFLLLMGFFASFCGFIYNDFLSTPVQIKTCYQKHENATVTRNGTCVSPLGIDPEWAISSNELSFINSFKMKVSVILGVLQMTLGVILKGCNAIFFKNYSEFLFCFIPQFIFMCIIFGYMDLLIVIKWLRDWKDEEISESPDIKEMLMNIFLNPLEVKFALYKTKDFMKNVHLSILGVSVLCIFVMLIPIPLIEYNKKKKKYEKEINNIDNALLLPKIEIEKPSFSTIFVHVVIETIEFVLGAISNTASYLRLWALSLAHSQLSKVLFEYGVLMAFSFTKNPYLEGILLAPFYFPFAYLTTGILLLMDFMECFLHTLRLHWVEFQGKFYHADGILFKPFCFNKVFEEK